MNVYEFLAAYFPPPMLGFLLGVGVGFGGGLVFSKGFFLYLSDGRRLRYERSDQEKQEKADQRRAAEEERNRLFLVFGIYWNRDLQPFCPACKTPLAPFHNSERDKMPISYCPKCEDDVFLRSKHLSHIDGCLAEVADYICMASSNVAGGLDEIPASLA